MFYDLYCGNETADIKKQRKTKWYHGGLAAAGAACITHPVDLIKVHLQTQQTEKLGIIPTTVLVVKRNGLLGLYNGISASLLRQLTYSTTRFAIYEMVKQSLGTTAPSFGVAVLLAAGAGAAGGFVGTPGDMINVRMQNDMKLPVEKRRNYNHALDGVIRVVREEGPTKLFNGAIAATIRAALMTIGQLAFYDTVKKILLNTGSFEDNTATHFVASSVAGIIATTITQPLDVIKTRMMNSKPGEFKGVLDAVLYTARIGPLAFYKGYIPAFVRIGPHTILTFLFLEQLRQNFGKL